MTLPDHILNLVAEYKRATSTSESSVAMRLADAMVKFIDEDNTCACGNIKEPGFMNDRIHPLQAMINGMNAAWQKERQKTQMTLGAFIKALEYLHPERKIVGVGEPMSYRGYYVDLAFEPTTELRTVAHVLASARSAMGKVFEGYKGGDFMMGESTPLWSATYGSCGLKILSLNIETDPISIVLAEEEEE